MEQYFSFGSWDTFDEGISFNDCILNRPLGHYTAGARISSIYFDLLNCMMDIYESEASEEPTVSFELTLLFKQLEN